MQGSQDNKPSFPVLIMLPPYLQNASRSWVLTQGIIQLLLLSIRRIAVYIIGASPLV